MNSHHLDRELIIVVPLPEDAGRRGDGRPKVRRFRRYHHQLGDRLAAFRERYGVTQVEVARTVGARDHSAASQWESGVNVPDGPLRERVAALLESQRWPELRAAMIGTSTDRLPAPWERAVRWYRRCTGREVHPVAGSVCLWRPALWPPPYGSYTLLRPQTRTAHEGDAANACPPAPPHDHARSHHRPTRPASTAGRHPPG